MSKQAPSQESSHHKLISQDHVAAALQSDKGEEAELLSWAIKDFTNIGDNFGSIVTSVEIFFRMGCESQSTSYVVKINPGNAFPDYRPIMDSQFVKEGEFYMRILPAMNKELKAIGQELLGCPKGIYNFFEEGNAIIFLEDLRCRGFKMLGDKDGLDVPHSRLALAEIARLHAASLLLQGRSCSGNLSEEYSSLKLDLHNCSDKAEGMIANLLCRAFEDIASMLQKCGGYELILKWLTDNKAKVLEIHKRQIDGCKPFDVICHGDCWHNNLLFRYDDDGAPVEVMMIDLPMNRKASLASDLNYFTYISLTTEIRRAYLDEFLSHYYSAFSNVISASRLSMSFTLQELHQEFRKGNEFGLIWGLYATLLFARPVEESPNFAEIADEEEFKKASGLSEKAIGIMSKDSRFWSRLMGILGDMVANGVIS